MRNPFQIAIPALCLFLASCDMKSQPKEKDPVESFKAFVSRFTANLSTDFPAGWDEGDGDGVTRSLVFKGSPRIDVQKTDSLVSPYLATLDMMAQQVKHKESWQETDGSPNSVVFTFAFQEKKWVIKSAKLSSYHYLQWEHNVELLDWNAQGVATRLKGAATRANED